MSSDNQGEKETWPGLAVVERRVLGVLVEKAKTTPENYPLSINGIVTGSNQKSNRDPLLNLQDSEVEEALLAMQGKGLTTRITGSRVERWRHNLYELWKVNKVELAVLAELLLRGAQTEGELRGRASRMEPIDDLETLRATLRPLAERGLVVFLGPEGRRGTQIVHGFLSAKELEWLKANVRNEEPATAAVSTAVPVASARAGDDKIVALEIEVADLRGELDRVKVTLAEVLGQVRELKNALGA